MIRIKVEKGKTASLLEKWAKRRALGWTVDENTGRGFFWGGSWTLEVVDRLPPKPAFFMIEDQPAGRWIKDKIRMAIRGLR